MQYSKDSGPRKAYAPGESLRLLPGQPSQRNRPRSGWSGLNSWPMNNERYFEDFHNDELKRYAIDGDGKRQYLQKGYLHLDYRIWYPDFSEQFRRFVTVARNVETMRFKPLLGVTLTTRRFRPDDANVRRIELKPRPIAYAGHFDALVYSFYNTVLSTLYEQYVKGSGLRECVLAYRKLGWNNVHFASDAFRHIQERGECVAITLDVKGFFDHLDHQKLKEAWIDVLCINPEFVGDKLPPDHFNLFRSLTKFAYIDKASIIDTLGLKDSQIPRLQKLCSDDELGLLRSLICVNDKPYGIPQGTPLSAVLSNIYMSSFDKAMCTFSGTRGWYYRRYSDDILLVCALTEIAEAEDLITTLLGGLKLQINVGKTEKVYFRKAASGGLRGYKFSEPTRLKNLQYLGLEFSGARSYIRAASMSRYHRRMKSAIGEAVKRTLGNNSKGRQVGRATLNKRYLNPREQNFPAYTIRATKVFDEAGLAHSIPRQLKNNRQRLRATIKKKTADRIYYLKNKGAKG